MLQWCTDMNLLTFLKQDKTFSQPVNWGVTAIMVALHLAALAAVFFFTWKALVLSPYSPQQMQHLTNCLPERLITC